MRIIDSHIHCGIQNVSQPFGDIEPLLQAAGIGEACLFAPVEDIYYRYRAQFDDEDNWRTCRVQAHKYLLDLATVKEGVYPYYFVWNDFAVEDLDTKFRGIKWHHHRGEPSYRYDDPGCTRMIDAICVRRLPIVLEETFANTLDFLARVAGRTPVIIPHLGLLNGGYRRLFAAGIWETASVYADTALAGGAEIIHFVDNYGCDRLLFGSDYPFGEPGAQLEALKHLGFEPRELEQICAGNILRLFAASG